MEYLNEFHRITTEDKLKAIAEMKKRPTNYEKEYMRHKEMLRLEREQEKKELLEKQKRDC